MRTRRKPDKFPLHLHATGQWAKKIRGKRHYFGTNQDAALTEYVRVRSDLEAGRLPRGGGRTTPGGEFTVAELANQFLTARRLKVDSGELTTRQWSEYHGICDRIVGRFGKSRVVSDLRPEDFAELRAEAAERLGVFALSKFVQMVRTIFIFAFDADLISTPIRYGDQFDKPPRRAMRLAKAEAGSKMIDAASLRKMIDLADPAMRAMVLLGLNCGYGNSDVAALNRSMLTERPGWINFPRPKTGIARRSPLWKETIEALEAAHKVRPAPLDPSDSDAAFLTSRGHGLRFVRFTLNAKGIGIRRDSIKKPFTQLAERAGIAVNGGFYTLRHVHRTVADGAKDRTACDVLMGHVDASMAATYLEGVDDTRLQAVVEHVRKWLFPDS